MSGKSTKEPQYSFMLDIKERYGLARFGLMANESWSNDPRRTLFTLARYKFVAKMLSGRDQVLEVGCADAFGTRLVQQEVTSVTAIDFDPIFIADVQSRIDPRWPLTAFVHDILAGPVVGEFDAAFSLDVLEHIEQKHEDQFIDNVAASLSPTGILIIGMPSKESQVYASPQSKEGHVNCKSSPELRKTLQKKFNSVFMFSMNDEVVHTGYHPMAHYLLAICAHLR